MWEFEVSRRDKMVYLICLIVLAISVYINVEMGDTTRSVIFSYLPGFFALFVGLSGKDKVITKAFRAIVLFLAFLWLGYMALHYLIGFHNPFWGN
ncbi:hypothetical protein ACFP65_01295 [Marinilactibacillus sp. GCM10026970]|uniref:hypothetical protein n=1 Tax=Marinilactibacillus sp. GCM10026970 TaxID=3252642 RepID=UPI003614986D